MLGWMHNRSMNFGTSIHFFFVIWTRTKEYGRQVYIIDQLICALRIAHYAKKDIGPPKKQKTTKKNTKKSATIDLEQFYFVVVMNGVNVCGGGLLYNSKLWLLGCPFLCVKWTHMAAIDSSPLPIGLSSKLDWPFIQLKRGLERTLRFSPSRHKCI